MGLTKLFTGQQGLQTSLGGLGTFGNKIAILAADIPATGDRIEIALSRTPTAADATNIVINANGGALWTNVNYVSQSIVGRLLTIIYDSTASYGQTITLTTGATSISYATGNFPAVTDFHVTNNVSGVGCALIFSQAMNSQYELWPLILW